MAHHDGSKEHDDLVKTIIVPDIPATTIEELPPPAAQLDGGPRAWLQIFGGFILYFNLWGYTFAFGSFQNFYDTEFLRGTSASSIAWIGSIQSFLLIMSGLFSGPLFDMGYFTASMYCGAFLSMVGAFMLSVSTKYWQIFLSQGICIGLGCGIMFVPTMALAARSFTRHRALAVGFMSCGAPVGSILYTFMFEGLLPKLGFAWTARSMAFFMTGVYVIAFPLLLWRTTNTGRIGNGNKRQLLDKDALKDLPFWSYSLATSTQFLAYLVPYFYIPTYAETKLGTTISVSSYMLVISQAASVPGRIGAAIAASQVGVMIPWVTCASIAGISCLVWARVHSLSNFIVFCAIYGCFSGPLIVLPPSVFPKVAPDPKVLGTRLGMAQAISSIANMCGPPIAGALLKSKGASKQNWLGIQLFSGLVLMGAVVQLFGLWYLLIHKRGARLIV